MATMGRKDVSKEIYYNHANGILHRQSPMMQAHMSGIVPLGETDFHYAEA